MKNTKNCDPLMRLLSLLNADIKVDDYGKINIVIDLDEYEKYKKVWELIDEKTRP